MPNDVIPIRGEIMGNNHSKRVVSVIAAVLMVIFGFVLGSSVMSTAASTAPIIVQQAATPQPATPLNESERVFSTIYNQVSPSVVSINVSGTSSDGSQFQAAGTGFVIDKQGHIVTN